MSRIGRAPIAIPAAITGLIYDGTEKTGVNAGTGYTLSGTYKATDVGTTDYTAAATLDSGYKWNDGTTDAGIVRNLSCPDTFIDTGSKLLRMLAHLLRLTIRNQVGNSGSHARQKTDPKADEERCNDYLQIILKILKAEAESLQ